MRERMSRPSSSVPNQWAWDGVPRRVGRLMAAGSCGAIQGANKAKITKRMTNTTPAAASGLWPAVRRNEMAAVDKLTCGILTVNKFCHRVNPSSLVPLVPAGADRSAQIKTLIEQRYGLSLGALIDLFFSGQNLDLFGQQIADGIAGPRGQDFGLPKRLLSEAHGHISLDHSGRLHFHLC